MIRAVSACLLALAMTAGPAFAEEGGHRTLGFGRLFTNDALGDGRDRWRTGGYVVSWMRGRDWSGVRPDMPLELVEYRLRADIFAPDDLVTPAPGDRPFAGALTVAAHTHWEWQGAELSFGAGLVGAGPMTGLGELQRIIHEALGMQTPQGALNNQIGNIVRPHIAAEAATQLGIGQTVALRPFVAAETGAETLLRVGGEILVGRIWSDALLLRDEATGQLYTGLRGERTGIGLVLGGDVAHVGSSAWLPADRGYRLTDLRSRARAGLRWQGRNASVFYGATWLGPEFRAQPDGQVLGSVQIDIKF